MRVPHPYVKSAVGAVIVAVLLFPGLQRYLVGGLTIGGIKE